MISPMTTTPTAVMPLIPALRPGIVESVGASAPASRSTFISDQVTTDTDISLTVDHGAAVLAGTGSAHDTVQAQRAVLALPGVRAVAQEVQPWGRAQDTDVRIARQVVHALSAAPDVPDSVQATVHRGQVVLCGEVQTQRQREAACRAVDRVWEARSVVNAMTVRAVAPRPA